MFTRFEIGIKHEYQWLLSKSPKIPKNPQTINCVNTNRSWSGGNNDDLVTYQNVNTVCTEKAHNERHYATKEQTGIVKGHWHGQNSSAQGALQ